MASNDLQWRQRRVALVISHPGHELRLHHWLEQARPLVFILTDGSGRSGRSRISSTTRILNATGARPGPIYGWFTDAQIYAAMLAGRHEPVEALLGELAGSLIAEGIDYVVADAIEGYNSSHDLCRHLVCAATEMVRRQTGNGIADYDFPLAARPDADRSGTVAGMIHLQLDRAALDRKLAAAESYPELAAELTEALQRFGRAAFATEQMRPVPAGPAFRDADDGIPFYERHGEKQKSAGHYSHVIRHRDHILPLAKALWKLAITT